MSISHRLCFIGVINSIFFLQKYDYERIYDNMLKPAFLFDGRMILNTEKLLNIGFRVESIGKKATQTKLPST